MMDLNDFVGQQQGRLREPDLKTIYVVVAGTGDRPEYYRPVQLAPGTTAHDILLQLGLRGFQFEKPGGSVFDHNEDIYAAVRDGQKLYAMKADVEAGTSHLPVS